MNSNNSNRSRAASARGFLARFTITPLAALGILAGTVPAARAADTTCPPAISSGTINGNLTVPAGVTCTLGPGTVTVTGNVHVGKGASLTVKPLGGQTVTIGGNVQAAQCNAVTLAPFADGFISVGGNVHIQNCTAESGYDGLPPDSAGPVTISGNFACDHNSAECIARGGFVSGNVRVDNNSNVGGSGAELLFNHVGGNVEVNNNSGGLAVTVASNTIGGNLQCARNTPGVTGGLSPNHVTGSKQGQCAGANF
jgi:hypothetical protein